MADAYPPYSVTLEGIGAIKKMTGTHAGTMVSSDPAPRIDLEFSLTHGPALVDPATGARLPNLILTLATKPQP
jgi:hypothetical protein